MKKNKSLYENPMIYIIVLILGIGVITMYSASSTIAINRYDKYSFFLNKHLLRIIVSIIAFIFMYNFDFKYLKSNSKSILFISWIILISAYFFNNDTSTRRWLIINGQNLFTTSDFAKLSLIIFTANFIEINKKNINNLGILALKYMPYILITLSLILFQPDLSTAFIISLILITMLLIAGLKIKYLVLPTFLSLIAVISKILATPYQLKRLYEWKNGILHTQIEHSIQALGNGGFFGVGLGKSIIKDGFMPEVHTDFILPIIGEEIGFIGILFIFILFFSIYYYGIKICKSSPDIFSSMLAFGITINILFYFLINASYVIGILPTTGLPIPFISYGGSHILFTMMSVGILLNISKYINIYKYKNL